jgi:hypothetical protein
VHLAFALGEYKIRPYEVFRVRPAIANDALLIAAWWENISGKFVGEN